MENNDKKDNNDIEESLESQELTPLLPKDTPINPNEEKISNLESELNKFKDQFLRLAAEYDNYKKTSARELNQAVKFAGESLISNLIPLIDNLETAVLAGKNTEDKAVKDLILGVEMVLKLWKDVLEKYGLKCFSVLRGDAFDPSRHEAVSDEESNEVEEGRIVKEYQKGYLLHERLLRPARVSVAKKPAIDGNVPS